MKITTRKILLPLVLVATSLASGAGMPGVDVTVSTGGKLVYQGKTNSSGVFGTGDIAPGAYVVQLTSKDSGRLKGKHFAVVVSAGKKKVTADVPGENFGGGGVAMKVAAGPGVRISGQVVDGASAMANNKNVKIVNGKKFYYVKEVGSNIYKWVEEGTPEAGNVIRSDNDGLRRMQDNGADTHQEGFPSTGR